MSYVNPAVYGSTDDMWHTVMEKTEVVTGAFRDPDEFSYVIRIVLTVITLAILNKMLRIIRSM
jgi:hypothetical protein